MWSLKAFCRLTDGVTALQSASVENANAGSALPSRLEKVDVLRS